MKDTNGLTVADTTYLPAAAGPLTSTTVTNAKGTRPPPTFTSRPAAAVKVTDPNDKITETEYDSLGRVTKVWLPNRSKALTRRRTTSTTTRSPAPPALGLDGNPQG